MKKSKTQKIIIIITDTLRVQNIGVYNKYSLLTPNIDNLGGKAVIFDNAYTTISKTDPAITSIMTGKYPISIGLVNHGRNVRGEEEENLSRVNFLSEILKSYGYKTAAVDWFSRWHKRGYDLYSGRIIKNPDSLSLVLDKWPLFFYLLRIIDKVTLKFLKREVFLRAYYAFSSRPISFYDPADVVIDKSIEILEENRNKKLFLYIHLWDAHYPHTRSKGLKSYLLDNVENTYNAETHFLDSQLGQLTDYLAATNQLEDALIVLTSDHGENLHEHGIPLNHEGLHEDVIRVPLILKHRLLPSKRVNSLIQHVDILPTVLDLVGISLPSHIDGKSLIPVILGERKNVREFAFFEDIVVRRLVKKRTRKRGIRVGNYKYIETLAGKDEDLLSVIPTGSIKKIRQELYNLKLDPLERENLIDKKEIIARQMQTKLKGIISTLNTEYLQSNKDIKQKIEKPSGELTFLGEDEESARDDKKRLMERLKQLGYW